jgi:hypothetical protein
MGFGLIIAVLGLGSTFAANININGGEPNIEFGQGLTQTVYCGENDEGESITVTPISAFVNSVDVDGELEWSEPVFTGKTFKRVGSISFSALGLRSFTDSYVNDATGVAETQIGYWVKDRISTDYYTRTPFVGPYPPTVVYDTFVPQEQKNGKYGFYYYASWTPGFTAETTEDKFEFGLDPEGDEIVIDMPGNLHLYLIYSDNDSGLYDFYAEVVDDQGLQEILEDEDNEDEQ